jgi:hypothetical protein
MGEPLMGSLGHLPPTNQLPCVEPLRGGTKRETRLGFVLLLDMVIDA